jgi:hypothetical protein
LFYLNLAASQQQSEKMPIFWTSYLAENLNNTVFWEVTQYILVEIYH